MSITGAGRGSSGAAAHLADEHVPGDAVPNSPFFGVLHANAVRQFRHGLVCFVCEPCLSQQVDYFLPAVLHEDNLLVEEERTRPTLTGYDSAASGVRIDGMVRWRIIRPIRAFPAARIGEAWTAQARSPGAKVVVTF
jgi:hypothetical protein